MRGQAIANLFSRCALAAGLAGAALGSACAPADFATLGAATSAKSERSADFGDGMPASAPSGSPGPQASTVPGDFFPLDAVARAGSVHGDPLAGNSGGAFDSSPAPAIGVPEAAVGDLPAHVDLGSPAAGGSDMSNPPVASPVPSSGATEPALPAPSPDFAFTCSGASGGATALYSAGGEALVAVSSGIYSYTAAGGWQAIATSLPCDRVPAALAVASGSLVAADADGVFTYLPGGPGWGRLIAGTAVADVDVLPDGTAGAAVGEDGTPYLFDGRYWTRYQPVPVSFGAVRVLDASSSYVLGPGVLYRSDGKALQIVAQPDPASAVAGLATRERGGTRELVATTRLGVYRLAGEAWAAELGPDPALYLGTPTFSGLLGFVAELGAAGGKTFAYDQGSGEWEPAAVPPVPLETTAALPGGDALALALDGETLYHYSLASRAWQRVTGP